MVVAEKFVAARNPVNVKEKRSVAVEKKGTLVVADLMHVQQYQLY